MIEAVIDASWFTKRRFVNSEYDITQKLLKIAKDFTTKFKSAIKQRCHQLGPHHDIRLCSWFYPVFSSCNNKLSSSISSTKAPANVVGRDSDWLRAGRSGDRNPVVARFSAAVQTGPRAHPASYTKRTGPFPGVKRQGCGVNHPPPSNA